MGDRDTETVGLQVNWPCRIIKKQQETLPHTYIPTATTQESFFVNLSKASKIVDLAAKGACHQSWQTELASLHPHEEKTNSHKLDADFHMHFVVGLHIQNIWGKNNQQIVKTK